jgi:deoxyxylulose-5-phosphate synthase
VTGNELGDEGAKHVSAALKTNQTLKQLSLSCTQSTMDVMINISLAIALAIGIGSEGIKHVVNGLMANSSVTILDLTGK